jgi:mannose-6-phosphate isomerase class I
MIYKLNDLSRQQLAQLVHSQKAAFLGHDSYRRFGARFPLHVKVTHSLNAQAFTPGQGIFCYVHRPVIGSGLVIAEVSVPTATNEPTTALTTAVYDLNDPMTIDYSGLDAFVTLIALEGSGELTEGNGDTISFCEGETVIIPANTKTVRIEGTIKFLEIYV